MKLFKTHKELFTLLLIRPIDEDVKKGWKFSIIVCGLFLFGLLILCLYGSIFHLFQYIDDLGEILCSISQIGAFVGAVLCFVVGIVIRPQFAVLIGKIQSIYDDSRE